MSLSAVLFNDVYNQNAWWIDLSDFPPVVSMLIQVATTLALAVFALRVPQSLSVRVVLAVPLVFVAGIAFSNGLSVFAKAAEGTLILGFPIPFSFFVFVGFVGMAALLICVGFVVPRAARFSRLKTLIVIVISLCVTGVLFPLGQMYCFGTSEYREKVDAAVVLGAQVYPDGTPSPVLQDRIDTAIGLYNSGLAPVLVMSGGIDSDRVSEAKAMRDYAVEAGVPIHDIIIDEYGSNTQSTARNTVDTLRAAGLRKVAAVSNFYHLARIKMLYLSEGMDVVTVPAKDIKAGDSPFNVVREIPGWWFYWLQILLQ
ncbi:MAG: YdcF family protein [Coriobacteriales bacterium]|nr:YdcF family protein [Coriobacteriales bacterium]